MRGARLLAMIVFALPCVGCEAPVSPRPSILLFVMDATRLDAISAYGHVKGTTPNIDALAAEGLRYTHAYANASWTVPSHATMFTGLTPRRHGVNWRHVRAPEALRTLAEILHDAGYETIGVAHNPWLSEEFGLTQGFEKFTTTGRTPMAMEDAVTDWIRERDPARPFFLFVNVLDPHKRYPTGSENPFLPAGVSVEEAAGIPQDGVTYFCRANADEPHVAILRSLYHAGVAKADQRLGWLLEQLQVATGERDIVTIVTSDHGEQFGEKKFFEHMLGVHEALLHIPLIVHGVPGAAVGVVNSPVQLADLTPTILSWAQAPVPAHLDGSLLPITTTRHDEQKTIVAEWYDPMGMNEPTFMARLHRIVLKRAREACDPMDRVFGNMQAFIRYPLKLVRYAQYPPALYDLSADPEEQNDLAPTHPADVAELTTALDVLLSGAPPATSPLADVTDADPRVSTRVLDQLRQLGYVDGTSDDAGP